MITNEMVDLYVEAIGEGLSRSKADNYSDAKAEARLYASSVVPEVREALNNSGNLYGMKDSEKTPQQRIISGIGRKIAKMGYKKKWIKAHSVNAVDCDKPDTMTSKFKACCRTGFVPEDNIIQILLGSDYNIATRMRHNLKDEFVFEQITNGWRVKALKNKKIDALEKQLAAIQSELNKLKS